MPEKIVKEPHKRHIIAVLVDNEFGVLARVIGLFSARGYNIDSLTVAEVESSEKMGLSRITIVTSGPKKIIDQIKALLLRLIPVHTVRDLTMDGPHIEREVGLFKVLTTDDKRKEAQKLADSFNARTIDSTKDSFIFELSDTPQNLDQFIDALRNHGLSEICRTGVTAIARGASTIDGEKAF